MYGRNEDRKIQFQLALVIILGLILGYGIFCVREGFADDCRARGGHLIRDQWNQHVVCIE